MGLDYELCRKAEEEQGWKVQFAGELLHSQRVEISNWLERKDRPFLGIGSEQLEGRLTYGFVDLNEKRVLQYFPFAMVYSGKEQHHQAEVLRAALLHLRHTISRRPADILLPAYLQGFVQPAHLQLLEPENEEVKTFQGGKIRIYTNTRESLEGLFQSFELPQDSPGKM